MDDTPSDNIRTAIAVCVGLTSGLIMMYYFIRLCRTIARFPKSDAEEVLPAYQPPTTLPATGTICYHIDNDEENSNGHHSSRASIPSSSTDFFLELRRARVPTTTIATAIPNVPSPAYSTLSRSSGYYYNGEMTQVGSPSSLPPGTFVIPMPAVPTRPARPARRSAGIGTLVARLSRQTPLLSVVNSNAPAGTGGSEPPPPSYSDVFGESSSQPSYQRIAPTATVV